MNTTCSKKGKERGSTVRRRKKEEPKEEEEEEEEEAHLEERQECQIGVIGPDVEHKVKELAGDLEGGLLGRRGGNLREAVLPNMLGGGPELQRHGNVDLREEEEKEKRKRKRPCCQVKHILLFLPLALSLFTSTFPCLMERIL